MGEKRGQTGKLINQFETGKCLEVYLEQQQRWHRVISKDFRSWNGNRRITEWDKNSDPIYNEYNGPIYYYMTNTVVKEPKEIGIQHLTAPLQLEPRQGENF
jgi:hypothetical protein